MRRTMPISDTITVHVPFRLVKRGGRKEMVLPVDRPTPRQTDDTLVKALARAFRWKRKLESGEFDTIAELAEREGIASSYMTRVLRLTLLAPETVEAILDGRQGPEVTLANLMEPFPLDWKAQTCPAIGLKQMGQAAACPNDVVLTLSRERPRRFFC